ncbi:hypothetical protein JTE90_019300 [Oedothorax gibbosus]|uniref:Uncharacterized protein n=1 Tax=Oedothorax gibbosus TaxID=931172 RepID=A0AAV6UW45_9ARAC|nr:hypothetical protein JTE90_019300 [Oedothorax gibbosus]
MLQHNGGLATHIEISLHLGNTSSYIYFDVPRLQLQIANWKQNGEIVCELPQNRARSTVKQITRECGSLILLKNESDLQDFVLSCAHLPYSVISSPGVVLTTNHLPHPPPLASEEASHEVPSSPAEARPHHETSIFFSRAFLIFSIQNDEDSLSSLFFYIDDDATLLALKAIIRGRIMFSGNETNRNCGQPFMSTDSVPSLTNQSPANNNGTILNEARQAKSQTCLMSGGVLCPDTRPKVGVKPLGVGNRWGCSGAVDSDLVDSKDFRQMSRIREYSRDICPVSKRSSARWIPIRYRGITRIPHLTSCDNLSN